MLLEWDKSRRQVDILSDQRSIHPQQPWIFLQVVISTPMKGIILLPMKGEPEVANVFFPKVRNIRTATEVLHDNL